MFVAVAIVVIVLLVVDAVVSVVCDDGEVLLLV